ncbi:uncharacterized [Tachysurus ichikawai]
MYKALHKYYQQPPASPNAVLGTTKQIQTARENQTHQLRHSIYSTVASNCASSTEISPILPSDGTKAPSTPCNVPEPNTHRHHSSRPTPTPAAAQTGISQSASASRH